MVHGMIILGMTDPENLKSSACFSVCMLCIESWMKLSMDALPLSLTSMEECMKMIAPLTPHSMRSHSKQEVMHLMHKTNSFYGNLVGCGIATPPKRFNPDSTEKIIL
jgi:hypothetical protein